MNSDLVLLGISCIPALAATLFTIPLWRMTKINNQIIFVCGLVILFTLLIGMLILTFGIINSPGIGLSSITVSSINLFLFRHYLRVLNTTRCPGWHHSTLHIHAFRHNVYRLYCRRCGLNTEWEE